ncbi:nitric oxide reductase D protein, partial [Rhodoblastus sp.]|uniref:nitric oxide reductase D protein n=1 Tax=Rhodoblastus sp. TaxID=1962975 RepID=UPI0035AFA941
MSLWGALVGSKFWEPEEAVGSLWNRFVDTLDAAPSYPEAAVALASVRGSLGVLFRGLGGERGVEIKAGADDLSHHRRSWRRRLARDRERVKCARFDGSTLFLPEQIDEFADPALNRQLYLWLAALAAAAKPGAPADDDPLRRDILRLRRADADAEAAVELYPGLRSIRAALYAATLVARPARQGPPLEAEIEDWIRARLGCAPAYRDTTLQRALAGDNAALNSLRAPADYRTYRPILLWGELSPAPAPGGRRLGDEPHEPGAGAEQGAEKTLKAKRRKSDQADRRDSLILHRFEAILSFGDFLNLNRDVDDDDEDSARKAAADADQIDLAQHHKKPRTRLKFDLDLAPEDGDREKLAGKFVYPEWDWKRATLVPEQARVLESEAPESPDGLKLDAAARRRIEAVRKRFEALRPRRKMLSRQVEGGEIDLDECVRALADRRANGEASDRLYRDARNEE